MIKKFVQHIIAIVTLIIAISLLASAATAYINPKYLHVLAFTGFLFPVLWVLNLATIIFNVSRNKWKLLGIGILVAILTLNQISDIYQISGASELTEKDKKEAIKIMSFNTRMFDYYKWTGTNNANEKIFDFIREKNPDVICFQEFFTSTNKNQYAEHHVLARLNQFPYHHIEYNVIGRNGRKFGQATFSKYPIIQKKQLSFANSSNFTTQTDIRIKDKTVRIYNNHLESIRLNTQHYNFLDSIKLKSEKETKKGLKEISNKLKHALDQRAKQSETIATHINNSPYPVIVCGDFNDTPISYVYKTMRGDLKDAFNEAGVGFQGTYNGKLPSFRIDFIFHDQGIETKQFNTYKVNFSDHYPIMATLKL